MKIMKALLTVAMSMCCLSCSSFTLAPKPVKEYVLDNGHPVYQYDAVRKDKTEGSLLTNYDGHSRDRKPAILHLTGSGCDSNLVKKDDGNISGRSFGDFVDVADDDHWVFTYEKRGVYPLDTKPPNEDARACRDEFLEQDDLAIRSGDNIELLEWLVKQPFVDSSKVMLAGCSEGGFVAAKIAKESRIPTHIGSFSGVGPTQMFDFLFFTRNLWRAADETDEANEKRVAKLFNTYREIMNDPDSLEKYYFGHPYKKWAIMFKAAPHEDLLKTNRPIFLAHASKDNASPIESADFVAVEFLRHGKRNLTYRRYPGLDHGFRSCQPMLFSMTKNGMKARKNKSCNPKEANQFPSVIRDFLNWSDDNKV